MSERDLSTRDLAEPPETNDNQPDDASEPLARERDADETTADRSVEQEPDSTSQEREPLLSGDESNRFSSRWHEVQAGFVDEPRESVAQADSLVAELMQQLAASFSEERERLEKQWDSGDDVSTEDLRVALTRYRSFFDRLLSA